MRVEGSHRIGGCLTVDGGLANAYMSHLEVRAFASLRVRSYAFHVLSSCGSARTGSCTGAGSGPHACRASRPTPPHRPDRSGPGRRSAAARTTPPRRSRYANHRRDRQRPPTPPDRGGRPDASPSALPALSTRTGPTRSPGRARSTSPPHSSNRATPPLLAPHQPGRATERWQIHQQHFALAVIPRRGPAPGTIQPARGYR